MAYTPKYEINSDINFTLEEIARLEYRIERTLIMPKHEQWLRREAFIRNAYSSTMVENASIPEEEMENVAQASFADGVPTDRQDVLNYSKALQFVDYLSDMQPTETTSMENTITYVHWILMHGINDERFKPGTYRNEPNWIVDQGTKVYEPPFHIDVPILMRDFSLWLKESGGISPIVKAGLAHLHLVAIHPFVDGNGRTARLLATLLLQQSGHGFRKLLSLDSYYQRNRDEYIDSLAKSIGPKYHEDYDATPWIKTFVESVYVQARSLERKLTDWKITIDKIHKDLNSSGLNERQIDGLIYAIRAGYITRKDYAEIGRVSTVTASRDLAEMVAKGKLQPEGVGRNRKYILPKPQKE